MAVAGHPPHRPVLAGTTAYGSCLGWNSFRNLASKRASGEACGTRGLGNQWPKTGASLRQVGRRWLRWPGALDQRRATWRRNRDGTGRFPGTAWYWQDPRSALRSHAPACVIGASILRRNSRFGSRSFYRLRLPSVMRRTSNLPSRFFPQTCWSPRKVNASGLVVPFHPLPHAGLSRRLRLLAGAARPRNSRPALVPSRDRAGADLKREPHWP
jgi:hypothetical protein